jgi:hypothetical protein
MRGFHNNSFDPQTLVVLETAFDEAWFTLKSNGITTVKPDELARCVLRLAMTSHPRPLGARRTDIQVAFRVMFGILHFIAVKKSRHDNNIGLVGDRASRGCIAPASIGPTPKRAGGHVWGTKAKPLAPMLPTALLSKPRTRLR